LLSIFTSQAKPAQARWRDTKLDAGLIVRWGADGFDDEPVAAGLYAPHSLKIHDGFVWWCDSYRACVCRNDGWRSPHLGGFTRGLRFHNGYCIVGLSASRVAPNPMLDVCGVCLFEPHNPEQQHLYQLESPYFEVYDILPLYDRELNKVSAARPAPGAMQKGA
jgi:hypothetical protein